MGIFERVERRLERTVNGVFARAFKADVQPVEIASAIRKAMDDRAVTPSRGHVLVPNVFTVVLSRTDYERLAEFEDDIIDELVVSAEEHVDSQHYTPAGPVAVSLERADDLDTGVFRVKPSKAKQASRPGSVPARAQPTPPPDLRQRSAPEPGAGRPAERRDEALRDLDPYGANPHDAAAANAGGGSRRSPTREEPRPVVPRRSRPGDRPYLASRDDRFLLMGAINVVGRDEDSDIVFDDPGISRRHSEVRVTTDGPHLVATVRDLGSTNGTFVNGERVASHRLQDGDRVTFGRTTVVYHAGRS
jgi:pSer/pThr/pTyr-binding forkhead associated (FHA) protein